MRHKAKTHSFGRRIGPRKSLLKGLVISLVEHGRIRTTVAKAKELRRHVERAVTIGKKGTVHARRILLARYSNKDCVATIMDDLAPRFKSRPGGYTRILKMGPRAGDMADMAFIEFVDYVLPTKAEAETVKGDTKAKARVRAKTRTDQKAKKAVRKIQTTSRREARATR